VAGQLGNLIYLVIAWMRVSSLMDSKVIGGAAELNS